MKAPDRPDGERSENNTLNPATRPAPKPALSVDFIKYAHHLEGLDLTEEDKRELLQALWLVACEFVSLGFDLHPVQQVRKDEENETKVIQNSRLLEENKISSLSQFVRETYNRSADPDADREHKESNYEDRIQNY